MMRRYKESGKQVRRRRINKHNQSNQSTGIDMTGYTKNFSIAADRSRERARDRSIKITNSFAQYSVHNGSVTRKHRDSLSLDNLYDEEAEKHYPLTSKNQTDRNKKVNDSINRSIKLLKRKL